MKYFIGLKKILNLIVKSLSQSLIRFRRKLPIVNCQQGMAALLTIVVIAAAGLIMAYTASILSIGELDMSFNSQKGSEAFSLADGCMEEALRRFKLDMAYDGGTLNLGSGSCIITIVHNDPNKVITISSALGEYNKKIRVEASVVDSNINILSWEELSS